jgi:hypothetical protein
VPTNQVLTLEQSQAKYIVDASEGKIAYSEILLPIKPVLNWKHKENEFVDFDRDKLVYHMLSGEGPQIAVADIDGDGLDDLYLGGAKDSPGVLLKQNSRQQFDEQQAELFEIDKSSEDTGTIFFDADTDGDLDLYVCSGGSEFSSISTALKDRLYINSGNGVFEKSEHVLPEISESTSVVRVSDYDKDGDLDLFIGTRSKLFGYGMPVNGYILENNGKGIFKNITNDIAKELIGIGMITDALWVDVDNDEDDDLIVVGEYMSVNIFINNNGKFERTELPNLNGWWNRLKAADLDADGDIDFVVANHGLNSRFRASLSHPISTYINDFDKNGTIEQIVCMYDGASSFSAGAQA